MSVTKVRRQKGHVYIVWWKDGSGRTRNKTLYRKTDADAFDAKIKLLKRSGDAGLLDAGKERLDAFYEEWWQLYAERHLAATTRNHYRRLANLYVLPRIGHYRLRGLTPLTLERFAADLEASGVGAATIRKTLAMLQGVLERAVEWQRLQTNPVRIVKRPAATRRRTIKAIPPSTVEALRSRCAKLADATLISVLAYAGLRPGEALALTWGDIGKDTIRVDKAVAIGEEKDTKNLKHRTVRMLRPLARDLTEWKLASGLHHDEAPVFPGPGRGWWTDSRYRNWRRRTYQPIAASAGLDSARPYDLRHSFASLLFAQGTNPAEVAEQMGHTLQTLLSTYVHVIEELRGTERKPAEDLIRTARHNTGHISVTCAAENGAAPQ